jgi:hypothetical protein
MVLIQNQSNKIETICSIPGQPANSVCKQRVSVWSNYDPIFGNAGTGSTSHSFSKGADQKARRTRPWKSAPWCC